MSANNNFVTDLFKSCHSGSSPVAVASLDTGGTAERCGLVIGDVFIRFNGDDVHKLGQKDVVQMFIKAADTPIQLLVKTVIVNQCYLNFF
jgi:hypothetical protein